MSKDTPNLTELSTLAAIRLLQDVCAKESAVQKGSTSLARLIDYQKEIGLLSEYGVAKNMDGMHQIHGHVFQ